MTPALVCGKHLLDLDHGLLRDITFSQHSAGVGRLSDGRSRQCPLSSVRPASAPGSTRTGRIYTVFTGEWEIGRIYETRGGPDNLRWFWSMPDDKIERSDDLGDANFRRVGMPGRHGRIGAARRLGDTDNS